MTTNVLRAILNIKNNKNNNLSNILVIPKRNASSLNRVNDMGTALEFFIRDAFCNTFKTKDPKTKIDAYSKNFSLISTQNHPPDLIIKDSDAVEVKKKDGISNSELPLNSSYPLSKLLSTNRLLTQECLTCEPGWTQKDIVYALGYVDDKELKLLLFVYGDCYAAKADIYENIRNKAVLSIGENLNNSSDTNEIGRINAIDPLKITDLRIRGMWTIQSPLVVFSHIFEYKKGIYDFTIITLMRKNKYSSLPKKDRNEIEKDKTLQIKDVKIQDPDNPAKQIEAKLIIYNKK